MWEGPQCPDEHGLAGCFHFKARGTEAAPTLKKSNVETKFYDVTISHDIFFAFDPQLAGFARFGKRA